MCAKVQDKAYFQEYYRRNKQKMLATTRAWRLDHPERVRGFYRQRAATDRRIVKDWVNAQKVAAGCVDCGYNANPAALDYDHVRGVKVLCVSQCHDIAGARREIAKCVVRCANCHRIKTYEEQEHLAERETVTEEPSLWEAAG